MPRQQWIMDVLADEFRGSKGFRVDAYPGWQTRGRELFNPNHVMDHHTGAGAYNNLLRYMAEGPVHPPLCNYATSRVHSGVVRITVVAAGRANHAGRGSYKTIPSNQGNRYSFGGEHQNTGKQVWEPQHLEAMRRCDAALLFAMGRDTTRMLDHKTYAPTRKVDRYAIGVDAERQEVSKLLQPESVDPFEEWFMSLSEEQQEVLKDFSQYLVDHGQGATPGSSLPYQFYKFNRDGERQFLRSMMSAVEELDSNPNAAIAYSIVAIRVLRAMGIPLDKATKDAVKDPHKQPTAEQLNLPILVD